jgi:hypothetical protein
MKRGLLLLMAPLLLLPGAAWGAAAWSKDCSAASVAASSTTGADRRIAAGELECYRFNDDTDSAVFIVLAPTALICLDPDVTTEGAATAEVMIRRCHAEATTVSVNTCFATLDSSLTGATGGSATQDACERYGPGVYYIEVTTSAGGNEALVSIKGEL